MLKRQGTSLTAMVSTKLILKLLSLTFTLGAIALIWVEVPASYDTISMKFLKTLMFIVSVELAKEYTECDKDNNKK